MLGRTARQPGRAALPGGPLDIMIRENRRVFRRRLADSAPSVPRSGGSCYDATAAAEYPKPVEVAPCVRLCLSGDTPGIVKG